MIYQGIDFYGPGSGNMLWCFLSGRNSTLGNAVVMGLVSDDLFLR